MKQKIVSVMLMVAVMMNICFETTPILASEVSYNTMQKIEKSIKKYKQYPKRSSNLISLLQILAEQDKDNKGLIAAVSCDEVSVGVENIDFFGADKNCTFNKAGRKDNAYVMAFTSKEYFRKFDDTSGIVKFIGDIFGIIEHKKNINGIVLNEGEEEAILKKRLIRAVLWIIDHDPKTE